MVKIVATTSLPVDRLTATDCNAAARANYATSNTTTANNGLTMTVMKNKLGLSCAKLSESWAYVALDYKLI